MRLIGGNMRDIVKSMKKLQGGATGLISFLFVFYIAWSGVITLNEIDQRQQILTEINSQIDTIINKGTSLVNVVLNEKDKVLDAKDLEAVKPELIILEDRLIELKKLRNGVISLVTAGARTEKDILLYIQYKVYFPDNESYNAEEFNTNQTLNKILPTKMVWSTSTGNLISMLTVIAAIAGALVQSIRAATKNNKITKGLFRTLSAGVGAGIICFLVLKGGVSIIFPEKMATTYNPHLSALVGFIAGMYSDSFYESVYVQASKFVNASNDEANELA